MAIARSSIRYIQACPGMPPCRMRRSNPRSVHQVSRTVGVGFEVLFGIQRRAAWAPRHLSPRHHLVRHGFCCCGRNTDLAQRGATHRCQTATTVAVAAMCLKSLSSWYNTCSVAPVTREVWKERNARTFPAGMQAASCNLQSNPLGVQESTKVIPQADGKMWMEAGAITLGCLVRE